MGSSAEHGPLFLKCGLSLICGSNQMQVQQAGGLGRQDRQDRCTAAGPGSLYWNVPDMLRNQKRPGGCLHYSYANREIKYRTFYSSNWKQATKRSKIFASPLACSNLQNNWKMHMGPRTRHKPFTFRLDGIGVGRHKRWGHAKIILVVGRIGRATLECKGAAIVD